MILRPSRGRLVAALPQIEGVADLDAGESCRSNPRASRRHLRQRQLRGSTGSPLGSMAAHAAAKKFALYTFLFHPRNFLRQHLQHESVATTKQPSTAH